MLVPLNSIHMETDAQKGQGPAHTTRCVKATLGLMSVLYECAMPKVAGGPGARCPRRLPVFPYPSHVCLVGLESEDLPSRRSLGHGALQVVMPSHKLCSSTEILLSSLPPSLPLPFLSWRSSSCNAGLSQYHGQRDRQPTVCGLTALGPALIQSGSPLVVSCWALIPTHS